MKIVKKDKRAIVPTYGTEGSAGMDMYSIESVDIIPGETVMVHTGVCMEIPQKFFGAVYPRSGIAAKRGLRLANCVGVIDSDYRGEIIVPIHNDSPVVQHIDCGERIAQMIIQPYIHPNLVVVDSLSDTDRGEGGFGHTGRA